MDNIHKTAGGKQELFSAIFENAVDAIITINEKGQIKSFNPSGERLFGYRENEVLGKNVKMLMPESYAKEHDTYLLNYLKTGKRKIIGIGREVEAQRKDGSTFPIHLSVSEAVVGQERTFIGIARDISDIKLIQKQIAESEAKANAILKSAVDCIITIDAKGIVQSINPACKRLFGYNPEEIMGKNIKVLMPSPYHEEHDFYLVNYIRSGKKKIIGSGREVVAKRKDGSTFPIHLSVSEFKLNTQQFFTGIIRDISDLKKAQAELAEGTHRLNSVLDTAVDSIITISDKAIIQTVNMAVTKLFGYTREELIGKNVKMLMPSPYHEQHDQYVNNYLHTGNKKIIGSGREVIAKRKDGSTFPAYLSVGEFKLNNQRFFSGFIHDLTQLDSIARQNRIRRSVLAINEGIQGDHTLKTLGEKIIITMTQQLQAISGVFYKVDDRILTMIAGCFYPLERKGKIVEFGQGLAGQSALEKKILSLERAEDFRIETSFGNAFPDILVAIPILFNESVVAVAELAFLDHFSQESREIVDNVVASLGFAINSARSNEEIKKLLEESQIQAEELQQANEELEQKSYELQAQQEELQQTNEELEEQRLALEGEKEKLANLNAALELSRHKIEEKVREAEDASRYKSEFLANMSHELRTPLNSIMILAQLMIQNKEGNLSERQIQNAKTIFSSGKDLLSLINDILDLTKVEAGQLDIVTSNVLVTDLAQGLEQIFTPQMREKGLDFSVEVRSDCPRFIVSDQGRIEQILRNLLSNALKFTEKGTIKVRFESGDLWQTKSNISKPTLAVSVQDSGIGISEEKIPIIFEAFKQLDSSLSRKYGGAGLGLSISNSLAKKLGGELKVESKIGQGSTFTLLLPEQLHDNSCLLENASKSLEIQKALITGSNVFQRVPKCRIEDDRSSLTKDDRLMLIIEDDIKFAQILIDQCHESGFKCIFSDNGEAGLEDAKKFLPQGILLDIRLPGMSGLAVLDQLKSHPKTRHIPVHVMSVEDRRNEALRMGAIGFLSKPVTKEGLFDVIEQIERVNFKKPKKLLLVEDNEVERDSIIQLIGEKDVKIESCETPDQALKLLQSNHFDCIIIDLMLKGGYGYEILDRYAASARPGTTAPIIIYTGKDLSKSEKQKLERLSESIIIKGVASPERLLDEVTLFLHRVETNLPEEKRKMQGLARLKDEILNGKKILVVDDDVRNVFSLRQILLEHDLEVQSAGDGKEAIDMLKQQPDIDLVLMDIMMPIMNGIDAIINIRKDVRFKKLPIIAITAKAMKKDREECLAAGANDYIAKPIDTSQLISLLRVWLSR